MSLNPFKRETLLEKQEREELEQLSARQKQEEKIKSSKKPAPKKK